MPPIRTPIYKATGLSNGEALRFTVYHLGGHKFDITCSGRGRPHHQFELQYNIDPGKVRDMIATTYDTRDIKITKIFPDGSTSV